MSLGLFRVVSCTEISQLSQMRLFYYKKTEPPVYQKRDVSTVTTTPFTHRKKDEHAKSTTLALAFIENVMSNRTKSVCLCNETGFEPLTLDRFNLQYSKSHFHDIFALQAGKAVDVANGLKSLHFNDKNVDIRDFNNSHVPVYMAMLKYYVQNDSHITGSGIAFENGFFPYVSKTPSGGTVLLNLGGNPKIVKANYYMVPKGRNYSKVWTTGGVSEVLGENHTAYIGKHEGFWTDPYYDCRNQEKWIITYSVPFFKLIQDQPAFG